MTAAEHVQRIALIAVAIVFIVRWFLAERELGRLRNRLTDFLIGHQAQAHSIKRLERQHDLAQDVVSAVNKGDNVKMAIAIMRLEETFVEEKKK